MLLLTNRKKEDVILKQFSEGDLSKNVQQSKNRHVNLFQKTIHMFRPFLQITKRSSKDLYAKVTGVAQSSANLEEEVSTVTHTMNELAKGIQQQADEAITISEQMNHVHSTTETLSSKHAQIFHSGEQIESTVETGIIQMNESSEKMNLLKSESKKNYEEAQNLMNASKEITYIIDLIQKLAKQTSLLSLNASIEASRAGEQGKGFAIVAKEIGELADQSKSATEDIETIIKSLQDQITHSNDRTLATLSLVDDTTSSIKQTEKNFHQIMEKVQQIKTDIKAVEKEGDTLIKSTETTKEALHQSAAINEELSAASQEVLASTLEQQQTIERMNITIHETTKDVFALSAVTSLFTLPNEQTNKHKVEALFKQALTIRGMMVNMIASTNHEQIVYWKQEKERTEEHLYDQIEKLSYVATNEEDTSNIQRFRKLWTTFNEITTLNTKLMLEGNAEQAKQNVATIGRKQFNKIVQLCTNWLA
ncbi:methyl-accepting chemotaxis protein [Alkalihalobacillus hemicellulosilyticus]|uniref:Methyl-accepting chemotaxis protein n=1 Tax=Halalkalibacter hemicellulosilyticusJCM 9152 TaxID=1236971 RepID=W4QGM8_9BACI|nr:methyl-accepting chemotaxis protein [Halalkalibacter hemicellulosilyticus]GAE31072.1 methyl-accepting chemotaxis protein [Halalkalibacter hemicellulosilyticusJCM 9152]